MKEKNVKFASSSDAYSLREFASDTLCGHSEGSRACARYSDINEDMKNELISLLD